MRIIIVGAGAVGSYLAERLSAGGLDVVVIDDNEQRATELQETIDALVLHGNGASASMLEEAGAAETDLLIAVINSDGANILACHAATELGVPATVARIEDELAVVVAPVVVPRDVVESGHSVGEHDRVRGTRCVASGRGRAPDEERHDPEEHP